MYLIGALVLAAGAGVLAWKKLSAPPPVTPQVTTVVASSAPKREEPPPLYAPPPPPKLDDEVDAGADAGAAGAKASGTPSGGASPCACSAKGEASPALSSALRARGQSAYACYKRALQRAEVSGSMMVSVQVGSTGQVCSATITNDSVGSSEVSSCVLGRFRGQSFPPPSGGCIVANIPISFTIKQ